uniref:Uncharacterized protein n=1 Tax=Leersia perrieri TaxID=77586 RepID=A0A0D9VLN5_9ORYZ
MEATGVQEAPVGQRRRTLVRKGKRAFAMKRHMYTRHHACSIVVYNRFGVWSQRHQSYTRKSRYLKFAEIGWDISNLNKWLRALKLQHGFFAWDEYKARQGEFLAAREPLHRLFMRRAAARFTRKELKARLQAQLRPPTAHE